jgi:hypothetical protein
MKIQKLRKETSERSDANNWAKKELNDKTNFYFESIEGCNQNTENIVTHLLERARFDFSEHEYTLDDVKNMIVELETIPVLQRKINFSKLFNIPLSYVLYCDENEEVYLFNFHTLEKFEFVTKYDSYKIFSDWIAEVKGWKSTKTFRENDDLPYFDKQLRIHKTAWPTNLDCFFTDENNNPIGIIEYQNADKIGVANHCNNDFLLCKMSYINGYGYTAYHDDIRRWTSQEIIRVQSNLRFFIITWATTNQDYILKEVDKISIPFFPPKENGTMDWDYSNKFKAAMNKYANSKNEETKNKILANGNTFNFIRTDTNQISINYNTPPLSIVAKSFPFIYYKYKNLTINNYENLNTEFKNLLSK